MRRIKAEDLTRGGDYSNCDLSGLNLKKKDLCGANFDGANLSYSEMDNTLLHLATFRGANLVGAILNYVEGSTNFDRANLENATITNSSLSKSWFVHANMKRTIAKCNNFYESDFYDADLREADLSFSDLRNTDGLPVLLNANLSQARFPTHWTTGTYLAGAKILEAEQIPPPKTHKARSISRHTVYLAYKILHWALFANRQNNKHHPVGRFEFAQWWYPNDDIEGESSRKTKDPNDKNRLSYYMRCRSQAHCRELLIRGLDLDLGDKWADTKIPPDVLWLLRDQAIPLLREHLQCGEDLARSIMLILTTKSMREGFEI
jgi:Pentapeptide repeats (8 copies)